MRRSLYRVWNVPTVSSAHGEGLLAPRSPGQNVGGETVPARPVRRLAFRVVAALNFLDAVRVVVEGAVVPAQNDLAKRGDGQMCLARAAGAHQQQASLCPDWISAQTFDDEFGLFEAAIPCGGFTLVSYRSVSKLSKSQCS